jgi:hypothetical protein
MWYKRQPSAGEIADEPYEQECITDPSTPKVSKTLLILGILLSLAGTIGYLGLRMGFIQYLFGITDPYPGIGTVEPSGHIVSSIPFVLGLVTLAFWGIRYDPIYRELERMKEEADEPVPDGFAKQMEDIETALNADTIPGEFSEPLADLEDMVSEEPILATQPAAYAEPIEGIDDLFDDLGEQTGEEPQMPSEGSPATELDDEEMPMLQAEAETAERKPLYPRTAESADESLAKLKSQFAEEMRMERCTKMLEHVLVLPDDKQRLLALIGSGISVGDFTDELEKAVNRRKKKEAEKHVTADEKASLLEDELISELAELEEEVGEDSEKLEEDILREIEDLERL